MARQPRHAEHDRLMGDNFEPRIIEMDKPGPNWIPIRSAPLRYQAISHSFWKQTLKPEKIEAFVTKTVDYHAFIQCRAEGFAFFVDEEGVLKEAIVAPYAPLEMADAVGRVFTEAVAVRIAAAWAQMEIRFRTAHRLGDCRVLARCGSPVAEHFTAVAPDAFAAFKIIDWRNGVAESVMGYRLYSIHAAAPSKDDQKALEFVRKFESSPVKLRVGQYFYQHHPEGMVGDVIRVSLITRIQDECFEPKKFGKIDEKTIRDAYKLFCKLISTKPSQELLNRIGFQTAKPQT